MRNFLSLHFVSRCWVSRFKIFFTNYCRSFSLLPSTFYLSLLLSAFYLPPSTCLYAAEDIRAKLNDSNGVSKFAIQDSNAVTVATIDSDGNFVLVGSATITATGNNCYGLVVSTGVLLSTAAGSVGIGTVVPTAKLEVQQLDTSQRYSLLVGTNTTAYHLVVSTFGVNKIVWADGTVQVSSPAAGGGNTGPSIEVSTINATATTPYGGINITSNTFIQGNVGIGTIASGTAKLDIRGSDTQKYNLAVGTSTAYSMVVSTDGRVGVGTVEPEQVFEIACSTWISMIFMKNEDNSGSVIRQKNSSNFLELRGGSEYDNGATIYLYGQDYMEQNGECTGNFEFQLGASTSRFIFWSAGLSELMVINSSGKVGIGTSNPGAKFEVVGGSSTFRGSDSNSAIAGFADASGNYRMLISTSGNVGIGTTAPQSKLDVDGNINIPLNNKYKINNYDVMVATATDNKYYATYAP